MPDKHLNFDNKKPFSRGTMKHLMLRKTVAQIQGEASTHELRRTLGKWNLVSLGIGCIIGAGIFVMTGTAAANHAGPAIILSFVLAGLVCAFAGLCYAELASVLPVSGSAYTYAYVTLGEVFAWTMGWLLLLEYGLAAATVAVGWSGYIVSFLKDFGIIIPAQWAAATGTMVKLPDGSEVQAIFNIPAFAGIIAVSSLLIVGVKESVTVNNVIVFIKVAVILAFIAIGALYVNPENWSPFIPENQGGDKFGVEGILRASAIIFFAYVGFEAVSTAAAEAKNPQKDMPFGIIGSLVICTAIYMAVALVLTGVVHYTALNVPDPLAVAVDQIKAPWLLFDFGGAEPFNMFAFFIKVGAIMGLSSVMLVLMYGQTRIFYTMSKDGLLPAFISKVHPKFQTPYLNTMTVGVLVAIAAGMMPISKLGDLVSLGTLSAFSIVCLSVLYLYYKEPNLKRPYTTPFKPFVPLAGMASCGYLIAQMPWSTFVQLKIFFLVGAVIYIFYGYRHSKLRLAQQPLAGGAEIVTKDNEKRTD
jgi:APA family basic amino acid/polyamine antiporter